MRNTKISVLYYPDMHVAETTLKKAILLFDEIHFIDRPSFTLNNFGTIGASSPLRAVEQSFQEAGVPLYVHSVQGGQIKGEFLERVNSDINDPLFLEKFKTGLESSSTFRNIHIQPGNYGKAGNEVDVLRKITNADLSSFLQTHGTAENLLSDDKIKPFDLSSPLGCAKQLVSFAALCSANLNFALTESAKNGFFPLADAAPYANLLSTQYVRAINKLEPTKNHIQITDLSFAIFDELVPTECIEKLSIKQVVDYRKASEKAREEFLEHLLLLQVKQTGISVDGDYAGIIEKLIRTEIIPAANTFRKKLQSINQSFFGTLGKGASTLIGGSSMVNIFVDLSLEKILALAAMASALAVNAAIDAVFAERATKRECSISYLLSLDK
jgi:hypothetical protein